MDLQVSYNSTMARRSARIAIKLENEPPEKTFEEDTETDSTETYSTRKRKTSPRILKVRDGLR
jgi:hypothetical protein